MSDGRVAIDTAPGGSSVVTIIEDKTAKWLALLALAFGVAYAVIGERTNYDVAHHAQMSADLANYAVTELRVEAAKAGIHLSAKKEKQK